VEPDEYAPLTVLGRQAAQAAARCRRADEKLFKLGLAVLTNPPDLATGCAAGFNGVGVFS
jgi:hypothetical protein